MQDIHTLGGGLGGGGGRIFSGGGVSGVDRRLQPQNLQNHQPLKCPRCDSQNTKFCYYNNYNLSQPRHFCKNCRRYWTKGGVLRNVPVGGGCRKSKRSSKAAKTSGSNREADITDSSKKNEQSENSHSSSESSSLTAATPAVNVVAAVGTAISSNEGVLLIDNESARSDTNIDIGQMGKLIPIMSSSNDLGLPGSKQEWQNEPEKMMVSKGVIDQDHEVLDWGNVGTLGDAHVTDTTIHANVGDGDGGGGGEHGLFDFAGVDEGYWNQAQWVDDNDQSFNFLPQFQVLDFNLDKK